MKINGIWVGWGLGDWSHNPDGSDNDPTVRNAKAYMRKMYRSYAGNLKDSNKFDQPMENAVNEMQQRLFASGALTSGNFIPRVLDLPTQIAMGFKKATPAPAGPELKPVIFTVEGHMSDMWSGPSASIGSQLSQEGLVFWQPVGYDCTSLPFNNNDGVQQLFYLLSNNVLKNEDTGQVLALFPPGTPWGITGFSQGAMVVCEFMMKYVIPTTAPLHYRLADFRRGLCHGNPRREQNAVCSWAIDPPAEGTQGIMDVLFVTKGTDLEDRWAEHPRKGDMFTENTTDDVGADKTAIAKIVCENSWTGGKMALTARILALFMNLPAQAYAAIKALVEAIIFAASNPNPHYSTVAQDGDFAWMRAGFE